MYHGFYTAASGMLNRQRTLNVIGNNMANAKTPGFRVGRLVTTSFTQELQTRIENGKKTRIGKGSPVQLTEEIDTLFDTAPIEETGRPFDMAIDGYGFFKLKTADGEEVLTRNGNFSRDEEGYLVLDGVGRLQGEEGDIYVPSANFGVLENGTVLDDKGEEIGKIPVYSTNPDNLKKHTNGSFIFAPKENSVDNAVNTDEMAQNAESGFSDDLVVTKNAKIMQGVIERSNIDVNNEMARLIETQRAFQSNIQVLKQLDQINQKTASQIASL